MNSHALKPHALTVEQMQEYSSVEQINEIFKLIDRYGIDDDKQLNRFLVILYTHLGYLSSASKQKVIDKVDQYLNKMNKNNFNTHRINLALLEIKYLQSLTVKARQILLDKYHWVLNHFSNHKNSWTLRINYLFLSSKHQLDNPISVGLSYLLNKNLFNFKPTARQLAEINVSLAIAYRDQNNFVEYTKYLNDAIASDDTYSGIYSTRAKLTYDLAAQQLENGNFNKFQHYSDKAEADYNRALELNPLAFEKKRKRELLRKQFSTQSKVSVVSQEPAFDLANDLEKDLENDLENDLAIDLNAEPECIESDYDATVKKLLALDDYYEVGIDYTILENNFFELARQNNKEHLVSATLKEASIGKGYATQFALTKNPNLTLTIDEVVDVKAAYHVLSPAIENPDVKFTEKENFLIKKACEILYKHIKDIKVELTPELFCDIARAYIMTNDISIKPKSMKLVSVSSLSLFSKPVGWVSALSNTSRHPVHAFGAGTSAFKKR